MKVLNKYKCSQEELSNGVSIMRGTLFGNPFVIGKDGNRTEVIEKYKEYLKDRILSDEEFTDELFLLYNTGKDLICCCAPQPCHGDVIIDLFNKFELSSEIR